MELRSSLAARGIAVAVLATVVVGCTATKTVHPPVPRPLPTSTITSAAELISRAFEHECAQFSTTYSAMVADANGTHTTDDLITLMAKHGGGWQHAFSAASQAGSGPGVPAGPNIARTLAAEIARDKVDLSKVRADIGRDSFGKISQAWNRAFTDLAATQSQC